MSDPTPSLPTTFEPARPHEVWIIQPPRQRVWVHVVLLAATFLTTMVVGARMQFNFENKKPFLALSDDGPSLFPVEWMWEAPARLKRGLPFSFTLMLILLAHETGHYLYARRYRVYATLPFFIPFPSLIGTLGAFIRIKSPIPSRAALFDIGIAGPIAGFLPASAAVFVGLFLSRSAASSAGFNNELGFPLAFKAAAWLLHIHQPLSRLPLHPVAVAGWVGMFATALNLLPAGQLDGGHILFSVFPRLHRLISVLTVLVLIPLTKYCWVGWLLWAVLLWLTSHHPPVPIDRGLVTARKWIAIFGLAILILSFHPAPIRGSGRDVWQQTWPSVRDWARHIRHGD